MASSRKADFNLNNIGKSINESDPTIANYVALWMTIKSGKTNVPDLHMFRNEEEAKKRMAELNEIYARGERPPLAQKFSNRKRKVSSNVFGNAKNKKAVKVINKETGEEMIFESTKQAARYLSMIERDKTAAAYEYILHSRSEFKNYIFETSGYFKPLKTKRKAVIAENIETREIIEFENLNKCAKYLKTVCECKVYREKLERILEKDRMIENWKIRYKEVQDAK